jgi:hypothetical protein
MIETTIPDIDVSELMERIRAKAAEIRGSNASSSSNALNVQLPPLRISAPPPPMVLPGPAPARKDRLLAMLRNAREKTEVSGWIPKPIRRFFRKQGGDNHILLDSVSLLTKANSELASRLEQLTACMEVQHGWLEHSCVSENRDGINLQTKPLLAIVGNNAARDGHIAAGSAQARSLQCCSCPKCRLLDAGRITKMAENVYAFEQRGVIESAAIRI